VLLLTHLQLAVIQQVLSSLKTYVPPSGEQMLNILNVLDPMLDSEKVSLVTATLDIFLLYSIKCK